MFVHRSNRLERLVDELADVLRRPQPNPFEPETILVQSRGMERWLKKELALRLEVFANARFPFPRALIEQALSRVLHDDPASVECYARPSLGWSIAAMLPGLTREPAFSPFTSYLRDDEHGIKRLELAERLADAFDQYMVYRPEWLLDWQCGRGGGLEGELWRRLVERQGAAHWPARYERFLAEFSPLFAAGAGLPKRVAIVGISTLPPGFIRVIETLATNSEVHLFLLCPSRGYFADTGPRRRSRRGVTHRPSAIDERALRHDNRLMVSLGKVGRDFQAVLEDAVEYMEDDVDLFVEPGLGSALAVLQSDLLALRRRARDAGPEPLPLAPGDDSVRVHACHSPQRELEVLRDQLLDLFERDPTLAPHDVVVMMPSVESYAPFIEAVFGGQDDENLQLPYRIFDRPRVAENVAADALLRVLDVLGGRMKASEVLDLLQLEPIRRRFGIAAEELALLRRWVREVNVRWGIDAEHRRAHGQPAEEANTWRFGLARLLLGYCMPGEDQAPFMSVLPYDDVEGEAAAALGSFADFCETLFGWVRRIAEPRAPRGWSETLTELTSDLVATTAADAWQTEELFEDLSELAVQAALGGFDETLDLRALCYLLRTRLGGARESSDFSDAGLTFSALLPMRSIPFRVVCLLGMNDGEFPRAEPHAVFDRLRSDARPGDRSLREEDRYLFLEAALSARERLIVSYVGRGIQDGSERPPAAVVSELIDVYRESFGLDENAREPVVVHPLQPFSPRYFGADDDPRLFGFGESRLSGARALLRAERRTPGAQSRLLPELEPPERLPLDDLVGFFEHPARFLFERRLQVELRERVDLVLDREPVELDALERYAIGSLLLERALKGGEPPSELEAARARGVLPYGVIGTCAFDDLSAEVTLVADASRPWLEGPRLPPVPLELSLTQTTLVGALRDVWPRAQVWRSYQRGHPKRELGLWIRHLALQCLDGAALPRHTVLVGRPDLVSDGTSAYQRTYQPLPAELAKRLLEDLLRLYSIGQTAPLCLFPAASLGYVEALAKYDGKVDRQERAFKVAREQLYGALGFKTFKEMDDPYYQAAYGHIDPFDRASWPFASGEADGPPSFDETARRVFVPLLRYSEKSVRK